MKQGVQRTRGREEGKPLGRPGLGHRSDTVPAASWREAVPHAAAGAHSWLPGPCAPSHAPTPVGTPPPAPSPRGSQEPWHFGCCYGNRCSLTEIFQMWRVDCCWNFLAYFAPFRFINELQNLFCQVSKTKIWSRLERRVGIGRRARRPSVWTKSLRAPGARPASLAYLHLLTLLPGLRAQGPHVTPVLSPLPPPGPGSSAHLPALPPWLWMPCRGRLLQWLRGQIARSILSDVFPFFFF